MATSTEPALSLTWYSAYSKCRAGSREVQRDKLRKDAMACQVYFLSLLARVGLDICPTCHTCQITQITGLLRQGEKSPRKQKTQNSKNQVSGQHAVTLGLGLHFLFCLRASCQVVGDSVGQADAGSQLQFWKCRGEIHALLSLKKQLSHCSELGDNYCVVVFFFFRSIR